LTLGWRLAVGQGAQVRDDAVDELLAPDPTLDLHQRAAEACDLVGDGADGERRIRSETVGQRRLTCCRTRSAPESGACEPFGSEEGGI
jgi:hypothetical protein